MKKVKICTRDGMHLESAADAIGVQGDCVILKAGDHLNIVAIFHAPQSVIVVEE